MAHMWVMRIVRQKQAGSSNASIPLILLTDPIVPPPCLVSTSLEPRFQRLSAPVANVSSRTIFFSAPSATAAPGRQRLHSEQVSTDEHTFRIFVRSPAF